MRSWAKINEIDTKPPFSPKRMNKRTHNKIINHYDFNLYDDWNVCTVHAGAHEIKVWYHVFVTYEAHGRVSASERKHTKANQVWVKIPFNHFQKTELAQQESECVFGCVLLGIWISMRLLYYCAHVRVCSIARLLRSEEVMTVTHLNALPSVRWLWLWYGAHGYTLKSTGITVW